MKRLRQRLIVLGLVSALGIGAQSIAQQPKSEFRSTSIMPGSCSTLPQAATTGAVLSGSVPAVYNPYSESSSGPRRTVGVGGGGVEPDPDPETPTEPSPIGDAILPLLLLAIGYAVLRKKVKVASK